VALRGCLPRLRSRDETPPPPWVKEVSCNCVIRRRLRTPLAASDSALIEPPTTGLARRLVSDRDRIVLGLPPS